MHIRNNYLLSLFQERLRNLFSNIDQLRAKGGVDSLLRGLVETPTENVDDNFSEEIIDFLFDGDVSQLDLVALNVQRSRWGGCCCFSFCLRCCCCCCCCCSFTFLLL